MNKGFLEPHSIYTLGEECGFNSHQSFFRAKKDRTTQHTTQQKNKTPKKLSSRGVLVESEGIEPSSIQAIEEPSTCLVII